MEPPEHRNRDHRSLALDGSGAGWWIEVKTPVRAGVVVLGDELLDDPPEMPLVEGNDVIQAFAPQRPDPALGHGVRLGRADRGQHRLDPEPTGATQSRP